MWGVGEEPMEDMDENTRSVFDMDPETQAIMEMMGKTYVSKDVKAADEQLDKERANQERSET